MKALLFCVFGICTLTLNAADLTPQQLAEAEKVAHDYVEAWKAGDIEKGIELSEENCGIDTVTKLANQVAKKDVLNSVLEWGKPYALEKGYVSIRIIPNMTDFTGTVWDKQKKWIVLVQVEGVWKVSFVDVLEPPRDLKNFNTTRKPANREKLLRIYKSTLEDAIKSMERRRNNK